MAEIIKVRSVYGNMYYVAKTDYENLAKTQLAFYTARGNRFTSTVRGQTAFRTGKCVSIHRGNIIEVIK